MSAHFSECGNYRYILLRSLAETGPKIGWMLHNPSTADADNEDRTSARGKSFSLRFGASVMAFLNPWAGIATKPKHLWEMDDPVGPENFAWIVQACQTIKDSGGFWIMAWGAVKPPRERREEAFAHLRGIEALIAATGVPMYALGVNQDNSPKHPLYVSADAPLIPWPIVNEPTALDLYLESFRRIPS